MEASITPRAPVSASHAGPISCSLFLVMSLQLTFTRDVGVKPDAFREPLTSFKRREADPPDVPAAQALGPPLRAR